MQRRENNRYYFSVEGETEKWYLQWLQEAINATPEATHTAKLVAAIAKDPLKHAKTLNVREETTVAHIFDRESEEACHTVQFNQTIQRMKEAKKQKRITYQLGYSNFTFELWLILHKMDCNDEKTHRAQYLSDINQAFAEYFEDLDHYKAEANFKRVLKQLTLSDVRQAIRRARAIMARLEENGHKPNCEHGKDYAYYTQNPSLRVWERIEKVLKECGVLAEPPLATRK